MTEIFINDQLIDIEDEEIITATYGNISFGNFAKKRGVNTNNFKIPITSRNKQILENAELFSSYTNTPYGYMTFRVEIGGVEVNKGLVVVNGASGKYYNLNAVAGISEFYNTINARKLVELDLSEYNHAWNKSNIIGSWTNTKGYIYAFVQYGIDTFGEEYMPDYLFPQVFLHTVIKKICLEAGYTCEGEVFNNQRFLRHIIGYSRFPEPFLFEGMINLSSTLPDATQSKVMLDFMNAYGLMTSVNTTDMVIRFDYIDKIIFSEPEDWSSKIDRSEDPEKELTLDLFQKSSFSWKTDDVIDNGGNHDVIIEDVKMEKEGFVYKSDFFVPNVSSILGTYGLAIMSVKETNGYKRLEVYDPAMTFDKGQHVYYNGTYYEALLLNGASAPKTPGIDVDYWKAVAKKDVIVYKQRIFYGIIEPIIDASIKIVFTSETVDALWIVKGDLLNWPETYNRHYVLFDSITKKPKKVRELLKIKYSDVNQIDFTRPKILGNEYGDQLFVLEEVTQFKLNKSDSTFCNFIPINMEGI